MKKLKRQQQRRQQHQQQTNSDEMNELFVTFLLTSLLLWKKHCK